MMKNFKYPKVFIYGMSGAGKDTISDYLKQFGYIKLRIAGTIKQFIYETTGYLNIADFEKAKRIDEAIRKAHHEFGEYYDKYGDINESSLNRLKLLISGDALEFDIDNDLINKPRCICDVRTIEEARILLDAGYYGIFLNRKSTTEYHNTKHKTDKDLFESGKIKELLTEYHDNMLLVLNSIETSTKKFDYIDKLVSEGFSANNIRLLGKHDVVKLLQLINIELKLDKNETETSNN